MCHAELGNPPFRPRRISDRPTLSRIGHNDGRDCRDLAESAQRGRVGAARQESEREREELKQRARIAEANASSMQKDHEQSEMKLLASEENADELRKTIDELQSQLELSKASFEGLNK